jgi:glyoxylase-like metal-dependent hydrolase (beta-lactamase superfamily II)
MSAHLQTVDLQFLGHEHVIATAVLHGSDGLVLIDPGPATTVPSLERGLQALGASLDDVHAILLTHIHLDHSGDTGTIVAAHPNIHVYVQERGAPHVIDPSRLVASATRLYKDDMARLWGEILPVPADRVHAIGEHADLDVAGLTIEAIWTPGHASHHLAYLDPVTRTAFCGDVAGMRRPGHTEVVPPTTPPEVDLEAWRQSTDQILAWQPQALFLTHFGLHTDPAAHLDRLWRRLDDWTARVSATLAETGPEVTDDTRAAEFSKGAFEDLATKSTPEDAKAHALAAPLWLNWAGLARYLRKRAEKG